MTKPETNESAAPQAKGNIQPIHGAEVSGSPAVAAPTPDAYQVIASGEGGFLASTVWITLADAKQDADEWRINGKETEIVPLYATNNGCRDQGRAPEAAPAVAAPDDKSGDALWAIALKWCPDRPLGCLSAIEEVLANSATRVSIVGEAQELLQQAADLMTSYISVNDHGETDTLSTNIYTFLNRYDYHYPKRPTE